MKNQVIKVLNSEHGKKVIEYWKSQGADTMSYDGSATEEDGHNSIYYGIIADKFDNYSLNAEAIICNNQEDAWAILKLMHDAGLKWCTGKTYKVTYKPKAKRLYL